ncbi:WD40-repeat-containing domain protein [Suillus occidentalis]|nr:WD40-repeat-containing domain protein [Suillus occidentalis]
MSSQTSEKQGTTAEITPIKEMRGHTSAVEGVVHLPGGRRIVTCSSDGSPRLWDLESGAQIGEDWKDERKKKVEIYSIALSPNGKTVVSGCWDGKVRLWDIETGKVIQRWTGHTNRVTSVCWSAGGDRVVSGSWDGTARVWNAKTGERILKIKTGHEDMWAVKYSPENTHITTGGLGGVKIWDAKTGELIKTLKRDGIVYSLAWTSDGKKLITASKGSIRTFDTATWKIATLDGHFEGLVSTISLSPNNRLLASASYDNTARIWNLDTNLPVGPPLQHGDKVECAAFSANGRVLVTGSRDKNAYAWDIHAILKQAGLEGLLSTDTNITPMDMIELTSESQGKPEIEHTPYSSVSSLSDKSFLQADATRGHDEFGGVDELPLRFFDGMGVNDDSSTAGGAHPHSSANALLARLASLLHRFRPDNADANEPSQPPMLSVLHLRVLFARLSSLIHRSPAENDAPNELQQPSTSSRLHLHAILVSLSSLFPHSQLNTEETESHTVTPSRSRPNALMGLLSSRFRSQHHTSEEIELSQLAMHPQVVDVAPMRDKEVLFVAERAQAVRPHHQSAGTPHSRPIRLLGHIGLYLCCIGRTLKDTRTNGAQLPQLETRRPLIRFVKRCFNDVEYPLKSQYTASGYTVPKLSSSVNVGNSTHHSSMPQPDDPS